MKSEVYLKVEQFTSRILCMINNNYEQYLDNDGRLVLRLKKALYGCVESARVWYEKLKIELIRLDFKINSYYSCVFNRRENDNSITTIAIHVDDMLVCAGNIAHIEEFISQLQNTFDLVIIIKEIY